MQLAGFPGDVVDTIHLLARGDRIREQQYLDFLKCAASARLFSVIRECGWKIRPARSGSLDCAWQARKPVHDTPDIRSDEEEEFRSLDGASMKTNLPLAKAAILHLTNCWPLAAPFDELLRETRALLGADCARTAEDASTLADLLMKIYTSGLVELHATPSRFTLRLSERPRPSPWPVSRPRAGLGDDTPALSGGAPDDVVRQLVVLLDGSRDHAAVLRDLQSLAEPGQQSNPFLPATGAEPARNGPPGSAEI